jgi:hypothetical protein
VSDLSARSNSVRVLEWSARLTAIAAVVLLATSLFLGWYALDYTKIAGTAGTTWSETYYPGYSVGHASFAGGPFGPGQVPNMSGFPGPRTLQLYVAVLVLVMAAIAAAVVATYSGFRNPRRGDGRTWTAVILADVGAILALATPLALIYLEPWAFGQDTGQGPPLPSPSSSFIGSCSGYANCSRSIGGSYGAWGPTAGWYLALIAGALLAGSALLATYLARSRVAK